MYVALVASNFAPTRELISRPYLHASVVYFYRQNGDHSRGPGVSLSVCSTKGADELRCSCLITYLCVSGHRRSRPLSDCDVPAAVHMVTGPSIITEGCEGRTCAQEERLERNRPVL